MLLLGLDIGSSSVKGALVEAATGKVVASTNFPQTEMPISAPHPGWAEQDPELWWEHTCTVLKTLVKQVDSALIKSIGIAYQMHGLVLLDSDFLIVRPSIIWCDSRAAEIGAAAEQVLGTAYCQEHLLGSPGNFTASKLRWVKEHEPEKYARVAHVMLPGEYIAFKLTGELQSSISGYSEMLLWDFKDSAVSQKLLNHFELHNAHFAEPKTSISHGGIVHDQAAAQSTLHAGIPVTYRAGDQPNNALALGAIKPGQVAATAGTSGVLYAVTDFAASDLESRINTFAHVNYTHASPMFGVLLCINGAGILYSWLKKLLGLDYAQMDKLAASVTQGSEGLFLYPFGNGAERLLGNQSKGASLQAIQFNTHSQAHICRAALEGIAFAFAYGAQVMKSCGVQIELVKAGNDNMFRSEVFSSTLADLLEADIEVLKSSGARGAAIASGVGIDLYPSLEEAPLSAQTDRLFRGQKNEYLQLQFENWQAALSN